MCLETNFLQKLGFGQVDSWTVEEIADSGSEYFHRSLGFQPMQGHIPMIHKGGTK